MSLRHWVVVRMAVVLPAFSYTCRHLQVAGAKAYPTLGLVLAVRSQQHNSWGSWSLPTPKPGIFRSSLLALQLRGLRGFRPRPCVLCKRP